MAHDPAKVTALRAAYLNGSPLESAAATAGIPYETARKIKARARAGGDDWDKVRAESLFADGALQDVLQATIRVELLRIQASQRAREELERMPLPEDEALRAEELGRRTLEQTAISSKISDSTSKLASVWVLTQKNPDILGVRLATINEFTQFVAAQFPAAYRLLAEPLEAFAKEAAGG